MMLKRNGEHVPDCGVFFKLQRRERLPDRAGASAERRCRSLFVLSREQPLRCVRGCRLQALHNVAEHIDAVLYLGMQQQRQRRADGIAAQFTAVMKKSHP